MPSASSFERGGGTPCGRRSDADDTVVTRWIKRERTLLRKAKTDRSVLPVAFRFSGHGSGAGTSSARPGVYGSSGKGIPKTWPQGETSVSRGKNPTVTVARLSTLKAARRRFK